MRDEGLGIGAVLFVLAVTAPIFYMAICSICRRTWECLCDLVVIGRVFRDLIRKDPRFAVKACSILMTLTSILMTMSGLVGSLWLAEITISAFALEFLWTCRIACQFNTSHRCRPG